MKWFLRILLVLVVLGAAAGAYYYYTNLPELPDERLACHSGAYRFPGGAIASLTPSSGKQNLRLTAMSGETWFLKPLAPGGDGVPTKFSASPGWTQKVLANVTVDLGSCADGKIDVGPLISGGLGERLAFDVKDTTFESHGLKLFGRLILPRGGERVPVAVLVHGSERDSAVVYNRLNNLFPANGIGVFVYDKRGTGRSEGSYTQNFHWLSDDAAAALNKAREMAGTRAGEIGFQGGSQAGWIEPLAATKTKTDFVLVGFGLAEGTLAEDREEVFDDLRTAGYSEDVITKAREITDATGRVMASDFTQGWDELEAVKRKYGNEKWFKAIKGEFTGTFLAYPAFALRILGPLFDVGTSWEYDPVPALRAYQGPHLWVLAGRDSSAPSENTLRILREIQVDRRNLSIVVFPAADHGIIEFEEKSGERIETRFSPGYFDLLVEWIKTKKITVPADTAVSYQAAADTPPTGAAVMDTP
jgi:pimeloyl-ACP methyl ester carboxylesterase